MNRIILVGNGFDKAIGLPTLYSDFMEWLIKDLCDKVNSEFYKIHNFESYWNQRLYLKDSFTDESKIIKIHTFNNKTITRDDFLNPNKNKEEFNYYLTNKKKQLRSNNELGKVRSLVIDVDLLIINSIIELLFKEYNENQQWGNIEQIYYDELIKTSNAKLLNKDFKVIIDKLEEYLNTIDIEKTINEKSKEYIQHIRNNIFAPINPNHICPSYIDKVVSEYYESLKEPGTVNKKVTDLLDKYKEIDPISFSSLSSFKDLVYDNDDFSKTELFKQENDDFNSVKYLILNFNYTNTLTFFNKTQTQEADIINIHGDLTENPNNPIIFGFGDELDKNYKLLEDKIDNAYLEHIKSVNYLSNKNYRDLIQFIESDAYQVFIFGHSCGLSDRTLLNTLFEHDNCVSIKPFPRADKNNYQETIMNIYRNFSDKRKLRKRVVNKELCTDTLTLDQKQKTTSI